MKVTIGPLPASRKIYLSGVPMREITQSRGNPPVVVYDTSGPYTDPQAQIDVERGLAKRRADWGWSGTQMAQARKGVVTPEMQFVAARENIDAAEAGTTAIHTLRDLFGPEWLRRRMDAMVIAGWLGRSQVRNRPHEAEAARVLAELIRTERLQ